MKSREEVADSFSPTTGYIRSATRATTTTKNVWNVLFDTGYQDGKRLGSFETRQARKNPKAQRGVGSKLPPRQAFTMPRQGT